MIISAHIQYPLRDIWVAKCRVMTAKQWMSQNPNHLPMNSSPMLPASTPSCFWASDNQLSNILPLYRKHFKPVIDFNLPRSPFPFRLEILPLAVNGSVDVLLEESLSFLLNKSSWHLIIVGKWLLTIDKGENEILIIIIRKRTQQD